MQTIWGEMQGLWNWDLINGWIKWVAFDHNQTVWRFWGNIAWCIEFLKGLDWDLEDVEGDYLNKFWVEVSKEFDWHDQANPKSSIRS